MGLGPDIEREIRERERLAFEREQEQVRWSAENDARIQREREAHAILVRQRIQECEDQLREAQAEALLTDFNQAVWGGQGVVSLSSGEEPKGGFNTAGVPFVFASARLIFSCPDVIHTGSGHFVGNAGITWHQDRKGSWEPRDNGLAIVVCFRRKIDSNLATNYPEFETHFNGGEIGFLQAHPFLSRTPQSSVRSFEQINMEPAGVLRGHYNIVTDSDSLREQLIAFGVETRLGNLPHPGIIAASSSDRIAHAGLGFQLRQLFRRK